MILLLLTEEIRNVENYKKTFRIEGQNSFAEYFSSVIFNILSEDLSGIFGEKSVHPYAEFYTDAIVCSFKKWITTKDFIQPQQFALFLKKTIIGVSKHVCDQCPPDLTDEILS